MAHLKKLTKGACGHMFKHFERAKDVDGNYIKFGNQDIDTSKSFLNYNLAVHQKKMQGEFVKERCNEVKCLNRKDVNVVCVWVVTAPLDLEEQKQGIFFKEVYSFLEKRYGKQNVVSAYVHLDETTPHMHFAFVPVVRDKKKGHLKVSAFEVIDKKELQVFHKDLQSYLDFKNIKCTVLNGVTNKQNKSIAELKEETIKKQLDIQKNTEKQKRLIDKITDIATSDLLPADAGSIKKHTNLFTKKVTSVKMNKKAYNHLLACKIENEKLKLFLDLSEKERKKLEESVTFDKIRVLKKENRLLKINNTSLKNKVSDLKNEIDLLKERVDELNNILTPEQKERLFKEYILKKQKEKNSDVMKKSRGPSV